MSTEQQNTEHKAVGTRVPGPPKLHRTRVVLAIVGALLAVAAVVVSGILPRLRAEQRVRLETNDMAVPWVTVVRPHASSAHQEIVLPASIQPYIDAPIYARTNGYLERWYADIGAREKKGQLLAEIESPEVDAELRQARADLATAEANLKLARITAARYENLLKSNSVSQQATDNATSDLAAKQTTVQSTEANVKRLEELVAFEKIYAPFDGVITARNTDVGQLIDSGASGGPAKELFHIADIRTLRVFVNVPQIDSLVARRGLSVDLTLPQYPGRRFRGTLVRTSNAIDPGSRTLLVEVDVPNPKGELLPGAYAEAHFKLPPSGRTYLVPVSALIFRSEGLQVATVDDGHHAMLKSIQVGRDFGDQIEVIAGLNKNEALITNPPDSLLNGEEVRPEAPAKNGGPQ